MFTTGRRARVKLPPADVDTSSGKARLSCRRAAKLFESATGGWTLHRLRHSAPTHAAGDGANTSTLPAYSGHTSVVSLARYAWPAQSEDLVVAARAVELSRSSPSAGSTTWDRIFNRSCGASRMRLCPLSSAYVRHEGSSRNRW